MIHIDQVRLDEKAAFMFAQKHPEHTEHRLIPFSPTDTSIAAWCLNCEKKITVLFADVLTGREKAP